MAAADPQPRLPLSRDRVLQAALELVDESGIEALTMRRLGQTLGYEAMSLYNHVRNKDDLLDGILDLVLAETEPPSQDEEWDATIRRSAVSVHEALVRHPWACSLLLSPGHVRPGRLGYMDALLGRLRSAGFSAETTYTAYHVLDAHIFGFSQWLGSHSYSSEQVTDLIAWFMQRVDEGGYRHLHEHAQQHLTEGPHREVSAFEFGLDLILDGLRKVRAQGST